MLDFVSRRFEPGGDEPMRIVYWSLWTILLVSLLVTLGFKGFFYTALCHLAMDFVVSPVKALLDKFLN
jgi:hypothetical protein